MYIYLPAYTSLSGLLKVIYLPQVVSVEATPGHGPFTPEPLDPRATSIDIYKGVKARNPKMQTLWGSWRNTSNTVASRSPQSESNKNKKENTNNTTNKNLFQHVKKRVDTFLPVSLPFVLPLLVLYSSSLEEQPCMTLMRAQAEICISWYITKHMHLGSLHCAAKKHECLVTLCCALLHPEPSEKICKQKKKLGLKSFEHSKWHETSRNKKKYLG